MRSAIAARRSSVAAGMFVAACLAVATAGCGSSSSGGASSKSGKSSGYPTKPVTLIVPFAAGGPADLSARMLAKFASSTFGKAVNVVNVTGAGGITGTQRAVTAAPDGYTLLVDTQATSAPLFASFKKLPFTLDQRAYVGEFSVQPQVFVVNAKSPYRTMKQLLAAAKQDPAKLTWAAAAPGSAIQYGILELLSAAGIPIKQTKMTIFSSGAAESAQAVANGEVLLGLVDPQQAKSLAAAGKVRILAVDQPQRASQFPDTMSTSDLGYPKASMNTFQAIAGPPGLPDDVVQAWTQLISKAVADPGVKAQAKAQGVDLTGDKMGQSMAGYVKQEYQELLPLAESTGIRR